MQRVAPQLIQAESSQREEQVITPDAPEAGERKPLEQPLEAPLRAPPRVAGERARLTTALLGPVAVGQQRAGPALVSALAAWTERDLVEITGATGKRNVGKAPGQSQADAREGVLAVAVLTVAAPTVEGEVEGGEIGDQKTRPRGLLQIALGERPRLAVETGRGRAQSEQPSA